MIKYPGWEQELKNIHDSFPSVRVAFSGSSSLALTKGGYDLSRRAALYRLPGLSFREYLNFTTGADHPPVSLDAILNDPGGHSEKLAQVPKLKGYFRRYLEEGFYPYVFEGGRRSKSRAQLTNASRSEYLVKDDILVGSKRTLPLYLFGFLY